MDAVIRENRPRVGYLLLALALPGTAYAGDGPEAAAAGADRAAVRGAIEKSLPWLAEKGDAWIEEQGCISCHHTSFLIWGYNEAARRGFAVDREKLAGWTDWSIEEQLEPHDKGGLVGDRNLEGLAQLILGRPAEGWGNEGRAAAAGKLTQMILAGQQEDGGWKPGGQLPSQKRPHAETVAVSTLWSALALEESGPGSVPPVADARARALGAAAAVTRGASTEWSAVRLLAAVAFEGDDVPVPLTRQEALDDLLGRQREDGGWGWVSADPSDALATGLALYALARAGVDPGQPAVSRAVRYLVETQAEDGSWTVMSTKKGKREKALATSTFWGTAWAVIGLLQGLPEDPP